MKSIKKIDTKVLLSTLWIMVMINMLKEGILSLYIPGSAEEFAALASRVVERLVETEPNRQTVYLS